jgi:Zn finger protein HypA/HybF involved in hydrogenase expression
MQTAQQFVCKKCRVLANVQTFEQTKDGVYFSRCPQCSSKNALVRTGVTPSQPGILPVTRLLD